MQRNAIIRHLVGTRITSDVLLGGNTVGRIVSAALGVGMLGVVEVTGYPIALEKTRWSEMDMVLDGLPQRKTSAHLVMS